MDRGCCATRSHWDVGVYLHKFQTHIKSSLSPLVVLGFKIHQEQRSSVQTIESSVWPKGVQSPGYPTAFSTDVLAHCCVPSPQIQPPNKLPLCWPTNPGCYESLQMQWGEKVTPPPQLLLCQWSRQCFFRSMRSPSGLSSDSSLLASFLLKLFLWLSCLLCVFLIVAAKKRCCSSYELIGQSMSSF